jgi:hypothetical protein
MNAYSNWSSGVQKRLPLVSKFEMTGHLCGRIPKSHDSRAMTEWSVVVEINGSNPLAFA